MLLEVQGNGWLHSALDRWLVRCSLLSLSLYHRPRQGGLSESRRTAPHIHTRTELKEDPRKMMPRQGKQSMAELKLRRLTEHNLRLKEDLDRPRVRVSEAAQRWVQQQQQQQKEDGVIRGEGVGGKLRTCRTG